MLSRVPVIILWSALVTLLACGPGRQAAWEQAGPSPASSEPSAPASPQSPEAQSLLSQADEAWAGRSTQQNVETAIKLWEQALASDPANADLLTKLSRAYYFLADGFLRTAGDEEAMLATYEKGILAGENAMMAISPEFREKVTAGAKVEEAVGVIPKEGQPAIYWYAANLGKFAVAKGFTTQLFYKDRIFAVMQQVLKLDEGFFFGAPHRYFGAFYAKAPAFAGGDMAKSKEHFDKALALDASGYFANKVLYAEYYATKSDDRELFTRLLKEVTEADLSALPELAAENNVEVAKAKELLSKIDELF